MTVLNSLRTGKIVKYFCEWTSVRHLKLSTIFKCLSSNCILIVLLSGCFIAEENHPFEQHEQLLVSDYKIKYPSGLYYSDDFSINIEYTDDSALIISLPLDLENIMSPIQWELTHFYVSDSMFEGAPIYLAAVEDFWSDEYKVDFFVPFNLLSDGSIGMFGMEEMLKIGPRDNFPQRIPAALQSRYILKRVGPPTTVR